MGRGRVELKRIENPTNRQVTFSKRRTGLLKKAFELSLLCDADVALLIFSPAGKLYQFASHDSMDRIIAKYRGALGIPHTDYYLNCPSNQLWKNEINELRRSIDALEARNRHLAGEDLASLSMKELRQVERQVKIGIDRVQAKKRRALSEYINILNKKVR
ncbi:hypothetical protein V2J09_006903 [Rumex salicifolius]